MKERIKKAVGLIVFMFVALFILCLGIPLTHDFLFDSFSVSNYETKEGIVSDVIIKEKDSGICENIIVDDYNIFIKCGEDYKGQFKVGDRTEYYVYKNKGYHTKDQMKSGSFIGKVLDFGMIGTYILMLYLIMHNRQKLTDYIYEMGGIKKI